MADYSQTYKGPIEGYVKNFLKKNMWRVSLMFDEQDMIEDSHIIYLKCCDYYLDDVEKPEHFMALFMKSFVRHFDSLSNKVTKYRDTIVFKDIEELDTLSMPVSNLGELLVMIDQAPPEVKQVLNFYFNTPRDKLVSYEAYWDRLNRRKIDSNDYLCELLGYDPECMDLVERCYEYFCK